MRNFSLIFKIALPAVFGIFLWSCSKLDTTTLGEDLIPVVDNIHTFADTLSIDATTALYPDSLLKIDGSSSHALGRINNDPLFGTTSADVFFELKPTVFPFSFGTAINDTLIGVDSVVLCMAYLGTYGDKNLPQQLDVYNVALNGNSDWDSTEIIKDVSYQPTLGSMLATKTVIPSDLSNYVRIANGKDSINNQIRIKLAANDIGLNTAFMNTLWSRDSAKNATANNAFYSDSTFRTFYKGFGVKASSPAANGLMYVGLNNPATRLEVHYRHKNGYGIDTTSKSFSLYTSALGTANRSSTANHIVRNFGGTQVLTPNTGFSYLATTPGTYINLKVPGITGLTNRIVHRAFIHVEQVPDNPVTDSLFQVPAYMYLDLKDTSATVQKWKPIYYDLNPLTRYYPDNNFSPFYPGQVDDNYFGVRPRSKVDLLTGRMHYYYDINVSRYIQRNILDAMPNYEFRLFAPFAIKYPQYSSAQLDYNNPLAFGRVRLGDGTNPNYKMKLIIIYSKVP